MWTKDEGDNYSHVSVYVDGMIYSGKKEKEFCSILENMKYNIKVVGPPTYHIGGEFKRVGEPEKMLTWGALIYVKRMMTNYNNTLCVEVTKKEIHEPLGSLDQPELDVSELCDSNKVKIYWQFIAKL